MTKRDVRIDVLRGIAMITILVNHFSYPIKYNLGLTGPILPTPTSLGYSSAASLFVAMSGYMVGMIYLHRDNAVRKVTSRSLKLYIVNSITFLVVAPLVLWTSDTTDQLLNLTALKQAPLTAAFDFLTFRYAPVYLNVLQLYVVLLMLTPIAIWLARKSVLLMAATSVLVWTAMQVLPSLLYPDIKFSGEGTGFNVAGWQLAFFLPMAAGSLRMHERMFTWFRERPMATFGLIGLVLLSAVARHFHVEDRLPYVEALTNRRFHSPIWTAHAALILCTYIAILAWLTPFMEWRPLRMVASLGRNSLAVFSTSIPLTYMLLIAFEQAEPGYAGYWIGLAILLTLSWANAYWADRQSAARKAKTKSPKMAARPYPQPV